jgi:hypothetical protein
MAHLIDTFLAGNVSVSEILQMSDLLDDASTKARLIEFLDLDRRREYAILALRAAAADQARRRAGASIDGTDTESPPAVPAMPAPRDSLPSTMRTSPYDAPPKKASSLANRSTMDYPTSRPPLGRSSSSATSSPPGTNHMDSMVLWSIHLQREAEAAEEAETAAEQPPPVS